MSRRTDLRCRLGRSPDKCCEGVAGTGAPSVPWLGSRAGETMDGQLHNRERPAMVPGSGRAATRFQMALMRRLKDADAWKAARDLGHAAAGNQRQRGLAD